MSVLTACVSPITNDVKGELEDEGYRPTTEGTATMLLSLRPDLPVLPEFPLNLNWDYDENSDLYTLDEKGVDALLNYRDNTIENYKRELELYESQMAVIENEIRSLNL